MMTMNDPGSVRQVVTLDRFASRFHAGFSLIEVLVGVLVVSVALAGLFTLYSVFMNVERQRQQQVAATAALVSMVERIKALPWDTLRAGFSGGACPSGVTPGSGVSLRCDSTETGPGLIQVTVQAFDSRGKLIDQIQFLRFIKGF